MKSSLVITSYFFCLCVLHISAQDMNNLGEENLLRGYLNPEYHWTIELPLWMPGYTSEFSYGEEEYDDGDGTEPEVPTHPIEKPEVGDLFSRLFSSNSYLKYFWGLKVVYKRDRLLAQVDVKAGVIGNDLKYNINDTKIADADLAMSFTRAFII